MTDGRLTYSAEGEVLKNFHVRDGFGIRLAQRAGLGVGILSGRGGPVLDRRARELDLDPILTGQSDKAQAFESFLSEHGLEAEQVAYAGDDWMDLPVLNRCGFGCAPADATAEVREHAHLVLATPGGYGAVREMVERILRPRGRWSDLLRPYLDG